MKSQKTLEVQFQVNQSQEQRIAKSKNPNNKQTWEEKYTKNLEKRTPRKSWDPSSLKVNKPKEGINIETPLKPLKNSPKTQIRWKIDLKKIFQHATFT